MNRREVQCCFVSHSHWSSSSALVRLSRKRSFYTTPLLELVFCHHAHIRRGSVHWNNRFCWRGYFTQWLSCHVTGGGVWKLDLPSCHMAAPLDILPRRFVALHSSLLNMAACVSRQRCVTLRRDASPSDSTKVTVCSTDSRSWLWLFKGPVRLLFRLVGWVNSSGSATSFSFDLFFIFSVRDLMIFFLFVLSVS